MTFNKKTQKERVLAVFSPSLFFLLYTHHSLRTQMTVNSDYVAWLLLSLSIPKDVLYAH